MKTSNENQKETLRVDGYYCNRTSYMSWENPFKIKRESEMWVQGELYFNKTTRRFEHEVTDENNNIMYIVVSQIF